MRWGKPPVRREALDDVVERAPLEVLHGDEVAPVVLVDLVGLHDVGVVEPRRDARLVEEHGEEARVLHQLRLELLDRDQLGEARRPLRRGEIDDAHATARDLGDQPIAPNAVIEGNIGPVQQHDGPRKHVRCVQSTGRRFALSIKTNIGFPVCNYYFDWWVVYKSKHRKSEDSPSRNARVTLFMRVQYRLHLVSRLNGKAESIYAYVASMSGRRNVSRHAV